MWLVWHTVANTNGTPSTRVSNMKTFFQPVRIENTKRTEETPGTPDNTDSNVNEVFEDRPTLNDNTPMTKVKAKTYSYNTEWEQEFARLKFDATKQVMYFSFCQTAPLKIIKDHPYVNGNQILKKDNVQKHNLSHHHILARDAYLAQQNPEQPGTIRHSIATSVAQAGKAALEEVS